MVPHRRVITWLTLLALLLSALPSFAGDEVLRRQAESPFHDLFGRLFGSERFGKSYALVIGVGDYDYGFGKLNAPKNDAQRVRDFLVKEAGFDYVQTLTDADATRDRISQLMDKDFPDRLQPNDRFLFYFSGHGVTRPLGIEDGKRGYLVLKKSHPQAWDEMIDMPRIREWSENVGRARHVLFVLDACSSGLAAFQVKGADARPMTLERLSQRSSYILTAGVDEEESFSVGGSSLFTQAFLLSVRGQLEPPPDGIVSLNGLIDRIHRYLDGQSQILDGKIRMSPQLFKWRPENNEGEFFFVVPGHLPQPAGPSLALQGIQSKSGDATPTAPGPDGTASHLAEEGRQAADRIRELTRIGLAAAEKGQCDVAAAGVGGTQEVARQAGDALKLTPFAQDTKQQMQALQEASRRCLSQASQAHPAQPEFRPKYPPDPAATSGPGRIICILPDKSGTLVSSREQCRNLNGLIYQ